MKSARFHEIREIRTKSTRFHEIKNVSFWVITKYRSFLRKTNQFKSYHRETETDRLTDRQMYVKPLPTRSVAPE